MFTRSKQANRRLQQSQAEVAELGARLHALRSGLPLLELDAQGQILDASAGWLRMLHYDLDQLLGQNHSCLCPAEAQVSAQEQRLWHSLGRGQPFTGTLQRLNGQGARRWLQAHYLPVLGREGQL